MTSRGSSAPEAAPRGRPLTSLRTPHRHRPRSGTLCPGFRVSPLTPSLAQRFGFETEEGVVISEVARYGAAAQAGVRPGQLIVEMEGQDGSSVEGARSIAESLESGSVLSLRVRDPEIGETLINFRV